MSQPVERKRDFLARIAGRLSPHPNEGTDSEGREPTPPNYTMIQAFEWYIPADQKHWKRLQYALRGLKSIGVDNLWIPPACKASSPQGNGYDIYDIYDLGEFEQKGSTPTKWGSKTDLENLCREAKSLGMGVYFDAVLNHKAAADEKEKCRAVRVSYENRLQDESEPFEIEGWLGFTFQGRGDRYSSMKYHWYHFTGTDYNAAGNDGKGETGIFRILGDGKSFARDVDTEKGNFDYLMFADLDYAHPEVREDVKNWGVWVAKELNIRGFRFDAIKHFSEEFLAEFIDHLDNTLGKDWFLVGEFWKTSLGDLTAYLERLRHKFNLFDAPLVSNFSSLSTSQEGDLRKIFDNTLVQAEPYNAVTLVMNHDTQPSQALEMPISDWFVPLAYALILLRADGYPCLFYGDLYGLKGGVQGDWKPPAFGGKIPELVLARKLYAYGEQNDYMSENPNLIGWVRRGTWDRPDGIAVVMSNARMGEIRMWAGKEHVGEKWTDVLDSDGQVEVEIDEEGFGLFPVGDCSVRVFVNRDAEGRDSFGKFDEKIYAWDLE